MFKILFISCSISRRDKVFKEAYSIYFITIINFPLDKVENTVNTIPSDRNLFFHLKSRSLRYPGPGFQDIISSLVTFWIFDDSQRF